MNLVRSGLVGLAIAVAALGCSAPAEEASPGTAEQANTAATVSILAGVPGGAGTADGDAKDARFTQPWRIVASPLGGAFVFDQGALRHVADDGAVTTLVRAESGLLAGRLDAMTVDPDGDVILGIDTERRGDVKVLRVRATDGDVQVVRAGFWAGYGLGATKDAVYAVRRGTVVRVDRATGAVTNVAGADMQRGYVDGAGATARFADSTRGVAFDGVRYLYVLEIQSITPVIRRIDVTTGDVSTLATKDAAGQPAALPGWEGLALGASGDTLLVAAIGAIAEVRLSDGRVASTKTKNMPGIASLAAMKSGKIVLIGYQEHVLRAFDRATGEAPAFAGTARDESELPSIDARRLRKVTGIVSDAAGNLVVSESGSYVDGFIARGLGLRRLDATTRALSRFSDAGSVGALGPRDGDAFWMLSAEIVSSTFNAVVERVDFTTGARTRVSPAQFWPAGGLDAIAPDGAGGIYFGGAHRVSRLDAGGSVTSIAGSQFLGHVDGTGAEVRFDTTKGIAFVPPSTLYVADSNNHVVRKVDAISGQVTTFAGSPQLAGHADGSGNTARFRNPSGLLLDAAKNALFVADTGNHVLRRVDLATGAVRTVAGVVGQGGIARLAANGVVTARLNAPQHLALLPDGSLAVSSANEDVVVRVVPASN